MTSKKRHRLASRPSKTGCRRAEGSDQKLAQGFFSDFARSWQEHGREMLYRLAAEQPLAYVRAMVKLALIEHAGSADLSEFDRQRYRDEVLERLDDISEIHSSTKAADPAIPRQRVKTATA
jgi:hypothetical protein